MVATHPMQHHRSAIRPFPRTVLWTRGEGCHELAELLAIGEAVQATGDPYEAGIRHRADMVVMKKVGSLDLLPVAAPEDFEPGSVTNVVAAVGEGPHSALAAVIAGRIASGLDVPAEAIMAVRPGAPRAGARRILDIARAGSGLKGNVVELKGAPEMVKSMDPTTLLVLGAPGGSWLHRQFFGPGARLLTRAPGGTIVVRDAPARAFQYMSEPYGVSPHMRIQDALAVVTTNVVPVVEDGGLVGIIRREALAKGDPIGEVGEVMEAPAFVEAIDAVDQIETLVEFFEGCAIPLVDRQGRLVGVLDPKNLPANV